MDLSMQQLLQYVVRAAVLLLCLPLHELAHGYAALSLGDDTAKKQGRLTLNPLRHLDPFGALSMLLLGFGWAKPVPVNPRRFQHPKRDMAFVSLMGPLANLGLAVVGMVLLKLTNMAAMLFVPDAAAMNILSMVLSNFVLINLVLAVFNLIPLPPLDGSRVLMLLLPQKVCDWIYRYEQFGMLVLLALVMFGFLGPVLGFCARWLFQVLDTLTRLIDVLYQFLAGGIYV